MNAYWNTIKDDKLLLDALKKQKDMYHEEMQSVVHQGRIYQNFYDSKTESSYNAHSVGYQRSSFLQKKFAYNIIAVIVESILNRVSRLRPKPSFISNSYLYSLKSKIKALDVQVLSTFKKQKLYDKSEICVKNSYIQNMGIMKTTPGDDTVMYFPVEIEDFFVYKPYEGHVDRKCAGDKTKSSVYEIYNDIYPNMDKKKQKMFIEKYKLEDIKEKLDDGTFEDKEIEIYDWYKVDEKNGRRVVWTDECILLDEKWDYDFLPYDFVYYIPPQRGLVGVGVSEVLTPLQQRLNTLLKKISKSMDISFYPIILAHVTSRVQRKFSDDAGQVVTWEGVTPPQQFTQSITHPQCFQHLDHLIHFSYRSLRMDETTTATSVPENVNKGSGVAIKNLETAEQTKLYQMSKTFESFVISIAKKTARYIIRENYEGIRGIIKDDKEFFKNINTWPVSIFPSTPEGKFQRAEFLIQAGLMTPEEIADLYDFPELAGSVLSQKGAKVSAVYEKIEKAISDGTAIAPDPILGYQKQLEVAEGIYGKLLLEKDKYKDQIKKMRIFIQLCGEALKRQQMQQLQEQLQMQQMLNPAPPQGGQAPAQQPAPQTG